MYELQLIDTNIVAKENGIELIGYDELNQQLDQLGEYLGSIEVTQDNIKENKKLVARVRKACNTLNEQRKAFKKSYLMPLTTLENQVKSIDKKAAKFEEQVRVQIRQIEEQERRDKESLIRDNFDRRLRAYGSPELYPFEDFLKREYLNKTYSLNKVEDEMAEWLEKRQNDIISLTSYSESIPQEQSEVITKYLELKDVSATIQHFTTLNQKKEQVKKAVKSAPKRANKPVVETTVLVRVKEKDLDKVKQLLELSNIEFEIA